MEHFSVRYLEPAAARLATEIEYQEIREHVDPRMTEFKDPRQHIAECFVREGDIALLAFRTNEQLVLQVVGTGWTLQPCQ